MSRVKELIHFMVILAVGLTIAVASSTTPAASEQPATAGASAPAATAPPAAAGNGEIDYIKAMDYIDSVISSIVMVQGPQGQHGLTKADFVNLEKASNYVRAGLAELKELKAAKPAEKK